MRVLLLRTRVPWKIVLPLITVSVTALLLFDVSVQLRVIRGLDDMPVVAAWGLAYLLNGPGFLLTKWLRLPVIRIFNHDVRDTGTLVGVALFWTWIGWLLDRRNNASEKQTPIIRPRWIRGLLYVLGLTYAGLTFFEAVFQIRNDELLRSNQLWTWLKTETVRDRLGRETIFLAALVWGSIYIVYFLQKLLLLRKRIYKDGSQRAERARLDESASA